MPEQRPFNHDEYLVEEVKNALLSQTDSAGIDVNVAAEDGEVRLTGVVDALSHKTAAEEITRKIPGVRGIENDITVANEETYSDKDLEDFVHERLARMPEYRGIGAKIHKGTVTLMGNAGSYGDVQEAVRLVEGVPGVRAVQAERVKVGVGEREDDADASRSAQRLLNQMGYDADQFQVYCADGVLHVKGLVPTPDDRSRIKTAMHEIQGVAKLEALLVSEDQMLQDDEVH